MIEQKYKNIYLTLSKENIINLELEDSLNNIFLEAKTEEFKNKIWYLKQVLIIKKNFLKIFDLLKIHFKHEEAWNLMEKTQILINFLENNPFLSNSVFQIDFIKETLDKFEILFPYHLFFSREMIIKSSRCSICGSIHNIRKFCGHIPGKVYNGELCSRIIEDCEMIALALVENPVDKYTMINVEGHEYNYYLIDTLIKNLTNPYEEFRLNQHTNYAKPRLGRNEICRCGSGKKYKNCHLEKDSIIIHYEILFNKPVEKEELKIVNTFKN